MILRRHEAILAVEECLTLGRKRRITASPELSLGLIVIRLY